MSSKDKSRAAAVGADRSAAAPEPAMGALDNAELADVEIAARAYSYWEQRGFQGGTPDGDWERAIRELKDERKK